MSRLKTAHTTLDHDDVNPQAQFCGLQSRDGHSEPTATSVLFDLIVLRAWSASVRQAIDDGSISGWKLVVDVME